MSLEHCKNLQDVKDHIHRFMDVWEKLDELDEEEVREHLDEAMWILQDCNEILVNVVEEETK